MSNYKQQLFVSVWAMEVLIRLLGPTMNKLLDSPYLRNFSTLNSGPTMGASFLDDKPSLHTPCN